MDVSERWLSEMAKDLVLFEQERPALLSISYRMLGERSAAEDVVQEVWLRFAAQTAELDNPSGWLRRVATNIAIDTLRSARARRESSGLNCVGFRPSSSDALR